MKPLEKANIKLPDIEGAWKAFKQKRIQQTPQNVLRASSLGYPCDRFHYYSIHDWKEKPLHDEILQSIFDEGSDHERLVIRDLNAIGFQIVENQRAFQLDSPKVSGHIDGILRFEGQDIPFDVKTIAPHDFAKINSIEDLINSKKIYQRNYPAQINLYLLMTNNEIGFLLFKNKVTGEIKTIWCQIDLEYCENLLRRGERVYIALDRKEAPERIDDFSICKQCAFNHLCLPDLAFGPSIQILDDSELASLLARREQLESSANEYDEIDKQIKETAKASGVGDRICGDWLLRVQELERKNKVADTFHYEVSKNFKTQIGKIK